MLSDMRPVLHQPLSLPASDKNALAWAPAPQGGFPAAAPPMA
ncbi:hypothetical protein [Paracidovorax wautersii]|uniref:Uncharacterized protein n=1 Tax=Paracidovorax wautersii TaxID=1177982 RepID=A0ABU1I742_9BURK|nr:hypothetical protein [Paracidovorax wautersii]MDR6213029.1 hypothetical protein [Paracidovorax wautersii]